MMRDDGRRRLLGRGTVAVLVAGVIAWAAGLFGGSRVEPGKLPAPPGLAAPALTATAIRAAAPIEEDVVGTVAARRRVVIAAQVAARVTDVAAQVGDAVRTGALLVALDDRDAAARYEEARARHARVQGFLARQAATAEQMEAAESAFTQARVALEHLRLLAPIAGVVAERLVEPGDMALPGRPLVVVFDPEALRLEATAREGLAGALATGSAVEVEVPAPGARVPAVVGEVLPAADPRSRTIEVRVPFTAPGARPGRFGRLRVKLGERATVRVPAAAVVRVGQLETVVLQTDGEWVRRLVTTGAAFADGSVEILSGLAGGEIVGVAASGR